MKKHEHHSRAQNDRPVGFQNLTVYKRIMEYLALEHAASRGFPADLRDQLDIAADSIVLNFSEGAGKKPHSRDRARYYGHAKGSATESVGGWDVACIRGYTDAGTRDQAQDLLAEITAMLSRMR